MTALWTRVHLRQTCSNDVMQQITLISGTGLFASLKFHGYL